ncbi:hypothetical protein [Blautia wexlerae]|uniref:hypothetical protein n=1 Tax=Blautia wexlerae TaxID=418240 RepID=UPI000413F377|nr:hypothetical protein [Blautia wexlerae]
MYIAIQMEIIILYDRIVLRKSETLAGLKDDEGVTVWEKHKEGIMSEYIWAPEMHYLNRHAMLMKI